MNCAPSGHGGVFQVGMVVGETALCFWWEWVEMLLLQVEILILQVGNLGGNADAKIPLLAGGLNLVLSVR